MTAPAAYTAAAAATWLGALWAAPLPLPLGGALLAAGLRLRSTAVLCAALVVLAAALGARCEQALVPAGRAEFDGEVTLVGDPVLERSALRVEVRAGARHLDAWAFGASALALRERLAGERVVVAGTVSPLPPESARLTERHVVGRLVVGSTGGWRDGGLPSRLANGFRRTLVAGTSSLDSEQRSLFAGLLLGDRRDQSAAMADAFSGSGLSHLMAVSGQNVAFALALATPLLARVRMLGRLVAAASLLFLFVLLTRMEPSVLRAATMAGLSATSTALGRRSDGLRVLAASCVVLILVDPLLVHRVAFQLSVAASAGILVLAGPIGRALPGPRRLAEALGVTVAAQLGVSPILVHVFGGVPVASLVANLAVAPVAGPVVMWGMSAGALAGVSGGHVARALHVPTRLGIGWIQVVAERCAALPLGEVEAVHLLVIGAGAALVAIARVAERRFGVALGTLVVVGCLVEPGLSLVSHSTIEVGLAPGARLHVHDGVSILELEAGSRSRAVLAGLRRAGVWRVDVVVALDGGRDAAEVVASLRERAEPAIVLAPRGHRVPGGVVPSPGRYVFGGSVQVVVRSNDERLDVEIAPLGVGRAPPV